jgi:thimet oligopeptidase
MSSRIFARQSLAILSLSLSFSLSLAAFAGAAQAQASKSTRPLVPLWNVAEIGQRCDAVLKSAAARVAAMEKVNGPGRILAEWDALWISGEDVMGNVYLLANVHTDKAVRDAGDACVLKITKFTTDIYQNEKLYKRLSALKTTNPIDAKLRRDLMDSFEDTGVSLPADKRARAKEIIDKLEDLRQAFDRNVRDDKTKVLMTEAEMAGMPESYVKAQKKDEQGNYVLGFDYPAYVPFMANATNESARQNFSRASARVARSIFPCWIRSWPCVLSWHSFTV